MGKFRIIIGDITNANTMILYMFGNTSMLNIVLNIGTNATANTNIAEPIIANNSILLFNIDVLNIDCLLFLTLYTCTNSDNANTKNAIVCPIFILISGAISAGINFPEAPIKNAIRVITPIITP